MGKIRSSTRKFCGRHPLFLAALVAAGASNSGSMSVTLNTLSAGAKAGTVTVAFESDGAQHRADAATLRDPDRRTYFKEEVGGLVVGWPLSMDGTEGPAAQATADGKVSFRNIRTLLACVARTARLALQPCGSGTKASPTSTGFRFTATPWPRMRRV